ncbi:G2/mitotic-specific cyclin S13-7-like isoform X1 [Rhodamnia argentea]|uniref:G2/mitotic-specific cyclin S13-7-like isoform X1 n=1 Tax=Rhodamnia argentea TaxID=178133 RepID=A0ABM3HM44_9MYRT|nr:G2/mitotic-specific cyclin S13-7-like isoform X1 [Rhodamnia argentea]
MASRPIVPVQARIGEAVIAGGGAKQQKKNGAAEGRNRKALGDIGNLVTLRGIEGKVQPHRPVTRSFCAQLLANAQAAAAAENNKKQAVVNVNGAPSILDGPGAGKRVEPAAAKAAQKKVVKPKQKVEVIDLTSDSEEVIEAKKKQHHEPTKKEGQRSSRRNMPTLTSVLTARSKAACGLTNKPKEQIVDIDAGDANNELAEVEYIEDIYSFYKEAENESLPRDYMPSQPEINEKMRAILVDWLIEIHNKFELMPETLYLTINIIDRFLSVKSVPRRELQLLGMGALFTASKYEEIWAPEVNDFVCIADRAYSHEQVLAMEKTILGKLEWTLTVPTHYVFLVRFIKASLGDRKLENMVYFLAELGVMNYATLTYCPSMVAASAVYAARCTLGLTPLWNDTLKLHTGFTESQLMDCAKLLVGYHAKAKDSKLQVVFKKYSHSQREAVAEIPPAKALLCEGGGPSSSSSSSSSS